jgi:hypothetical protein
MFLYSHEKCSSAHSCSSLFGCTVRVRKQIAQWHLCTYSKLKNVLFSYEKCSSVHCCRPVSGCVVTAVRLIALQLPCIHTMLLNILVQPWNMSSFFSLQMHFSRAPSEILLAFQSYELVFHTYIHTYIHTYTNTYKYFGTDVLVYSFHSTSIHTYL